MLAHGGTAPSTPAFGMTPMAAVSTFRAGVVKAATLTDACELMRGGARCVVVPGAFPCRAAKLADYYGLPPGYDTRDILLSNGAPEATLDIDGELTADLNALGAIHRRATGSCKSLGRVTRAAGTPCPKAHVDRLTLRAIATLRGPGTVLLGSQNNDDVVMRLQEGDAVFMVGDPLDGAPTPPEDLVWHRSPKREEGMEDRVIVRVDDYNSWCC